MNARALRHPVYVETLDETIDALGGMSLTYALDSSIGQPWRVSIEPLSGRSFHPLNLPTNMQAMLHHAPTTTS